ncbi:hypothetical protein CerSpe_207040 [Prunus speciosa]
MADKLVNNGPWQVMKQCFSMRRWPPTLAIEEIQVKHVAFWVQVRGIPLNLCHKENMVKIGDRIGEIIEYKNPNQTRGFLRFRVWIDTTNPLPTGFWLPRADGSETWVEFQFERLGDFCYKCKRIGHCMKDCSYEAPAEGSAKYGDWTRAMIIREIYEPKPKNIITGERRLEQTKGKEKRCVRGNRWEDAGEKVRPRIEQIKSVRMAVSGLENNRWRRVLNIL